MYVHVHVHTCTCTCKLCTLYMHEDYKKLLLKYMYMCIRDENNNVCQGLINAGMICQGFINTV